MKYYLITPLIYLAVAQSTQSFASAECRWKSWSQVLDQALESSPELTPLEKRRAFGQIRSDVATVGPAARASAQYVSGGSANSGEGEVSYEWIFERTEKKATRAKSAQSEVNYTGAEILERKASMILDVALISERVHQIHHEKEVLNETLSTYRTILKQYANFPALSPEQDVTVSIFRLARDETQLKLGKLGVELENYKSLLGRLTGCSQVMLPPEVRKERHNWPKVASIDSLKDSATARRIEAKKQVARDNMEMEIRQTSADYSIGPMARWTREEGDQKFGFGVALSVPLVGRQAAATTATAQAGYQVAEAEADLELKRVTSDLGRWITQYNNSVAVLKEGFAEADVHGKHRQMEKVFIAGRVNASLVIEAHRQMFEHMVSRHEVEAKASESLWNIRLLTGSISKDDL
jgi:hypothetical protein